MACNCNKDADSSDPNLPGVPTPDSSFDLMKWLPFLLILIAIGWLFFLKSKGPHT